MLNSNVIDSRSCIEQAEKQYGGLPHQQNTTNIPNSKAIVMHYSWDESTAWKVTL